VDHQRLAQPLRVVVLHEAEEDNFFFIAIVHEARLLLRRIEQSYAEEDNQRTNFVLCQRRRNFSIRKKRRGKLLCAFIFIYLFTESVQK
jgi:hypothetical protein